MNVFWQNACNWASFYPTVVDVQSFKLSITWHAKEKMKLFSASSFDRRNYGNQLHKFRVRNSVNEKGYCCPKRTGSPTRKSARRPSELIDGDAQNAFVKSVSLFCASVHCQIGSRWREIKKISDLPTTNMRFDDSRGVTACDRWNGRLTKWPGKSYPVNSPSKTVD